MIKEKRIEWTTGTKQHAVVTIEMLVSHRGEVFVEIKARVDGKLVGTGKPIPMDHPIAVAEIGRLAMIKENADRVNNAIAEIESEPEYQEYKARCEQGRKDAEEYNKADAMIRSAMGI